MPTKLMGLLVGVCLVAAGFIARRPHVNSARSELRMVTCIIPRCHALHKMLLGLLTEERLTMWMS